ncbi:MAG: class I SAM-dependent methyltransferase [Methylococcaceae bacterium]
MQRISLVNTAHNLIKEVLHSGAIAIDATVGNGHDTLFLVEQVSPSGKVFGFDIQQAAIESTQEKCLQTHHPECLTLIHAGHADMADRIPAHHHGNISVIMFNLGYLPGGDKAIITCTDSTITALQSAGQLLSTQGIITIMAYPGHSGGDLETALVKNWCEQLDDKQFKSSIIYSSENKDSAPRLFVIQKTQ